MDTPTATPLPRLRVSRQSQSIAHDFATSQNNISQAGPSRLPEDSWTEFNESHHETNAGVNNSDAAQLSLSSALPANPSIILEDTPAERLRAVLARVPRGSKAKAPEAPTPSSSSSVELDSDFDIPEYGSSQPSLARESLKELFSRVRRDPGDTPQKKLKEKLRRNSIDASEFESSPRVETVKRERSSNRGKRRSMSDDEVESADTTEISLLSSHAAIFDTLRQKLDSSRFRQPDSALQTKKDDLDANESTDTTDTVKLLRDLNSSRSTPPAATSTPQHNSIKMSINPEFQSNLLDLDSEMQQAMRGLDSYEVSSHEIIDHPLRQEISSSKTPVANIRHHSTPNLLTSRAEHSHSGRARSRSREPSENGHIHERDWTKNPSQPHANPSEHRHSSHGAILASSPIPTPILNHEHSSLARRGSSSSLRSFDDDASSKRTSSISSQAEYRELLKEREQERNLEREHNWNKPRASISSRPTNYNVHSPSARLRTSSTPARADSRLSMTSPKPKHHSRSSSRTSSNGSIISLNDGTEIETEFQVEVEHERERNWNSPRPQWHPHSSRPTSSLSLHSPTANRERTHSVPSHHSKVDEPDEPSMRHRHHSLASSHSSSYTSSRASSPSINSRSAGEKESMKELVTEVQHERERHWSASRPHWAHTRSHSSIQDGHGSSPALNRSHSVNPSPSTSSIASAQQPKPVAHKPRVRAESLRTTQSPSLHAHSPVRERDTSNSPAASGKSLRALSPLPNVKAKASSSTLSPSTKRPVLASRLANHPNRPVSPSPPITNGNTSYDKTKSDKSPSQSTSTSSVRFASSRTSLHHGSPTTRSQIHAQTQSSPSSPPQPRSRTVSNLNDRTSHIPVRTSLNGNPGKLLFPSSDRSSSDVRQDVSLSQPQHQSEHHQEVPSVYVNEAPRNEEALRDPAQSSEHVLTDTDDEEEDLAQERTPTLHAKAALPSPDPEVPVQSPLPISAGMNDEARLKKVITSPPSPPPSPPSDIPSTPEPPQHIFPFPSTPPKFPSFSTSKLEFETPSPPKYLPDLPDPPSSASSDDGEFPLQEPQSSAFPGSLSVAKTPKPPGAWVLTPIPQRHNPLIRSHSLPTDDEKEGDSGLATPVASLSRAASMPPQTPALPGGWLTTPFKKSVRFQQDSALESEQSLDESVKDSVQDEHVQPEENGRPVQKDGSLKPSVDVGKSEENENFKPPPPLIQVSPPRRPRSPRKTPGIRVVDAFGRKHPDEERQKDTSRNRSVVRIVDAMGRAVEEPDSVEPSDSDGLPLTRQEAVQRITSGLRSLVEDIKDGEQALVETDEIRNRIQKLEEASRAARASRGQLAKELSVSTEEIKTRLAPLRASMQRSGTTSPMFPGRRLSAARAWFVWGLVQIFLIIVMYRIAISYAKHMYLTTYYDPFYPDLYRFSSTHYSTASVTETFWREGFKASALRALNNMIINISAWRLPGWKPMGVDDVRASGSWAPT